MSMAGIPLTPLEVGRSGLAQCFVSGELGGVAGEIGGDAGEIGGDAGGGRFSFMKDHASCAHCNSGLSAAPSAACRLPSVALLTAAALFLEHEQTLLTQKHEAAMAEAHRATLIQREKEQRYAAALSAGRCSEEYRVHYDSWHPSFKWGA